MTKDLAYYLSLNYPTGVDRSDEKEGIVVAFHPDLPGCVAQGSTANEALSNLDEARAAWIAAGLSDRQPIPEPPDENYGGKVLVRMMPALHAAVARIAARQGVSTNQFIVTTLAEATGFGRAVDYLGIVREEMTAAAKAVQYRPPMQKSLSLTPKPLSQSELLNPLVQRRGVH